MNNFSHRFLLSAISASVLLLGTAPEVFAGPRAKGEARHQVHRGGGGGGPKPQINHSAKPRANQGGGKIGSNNQRGGNKVNIDNSRRNNVNVNRDVDIHVDGHDRGRGGHGCRDCWDDDDDFHPFATAAAVTAGVALTSAVIGSISNSIPANCVPVARNGVTYQQCGSTWYQPQYSGSNVTYVVVNPPYTSP